jgi:hypothetical protein
MELDPAIILGPFLESVAEAQKLVEHTLDLPLPQADREMVLGFQGHIREKKALLESLGPEFLRRSSQGLNEGMRRLAELEKEKERVLQDLDHLKQRAMGAAEEIKKAGKEYSNKPRRRVPVPQAALPTAAKPLELSEGRALRELLLPTATQPAPQAPKQIGNIWEGWHRQGPVDPASHAEEDFDHHEEEDGHGHPRF